MKNRVLTVLGLCLLLACANSALAQKMDLTEIVNVMIDKPADSAKLESPGDHSHFKASGTISNQVREKVIQTLLKKTKPENQANLRQQLEKVDILKSMDEKLAIKGYDAYDLATAYMTWVTVSYDILQGKIPPANVQALYKQFDHTIDHNPYYAQLTDARKQVLAETYYWMALLFKLTEQQVTKGVISKKTLRTDVINALKKRHIEYRTAKLTSEGLSN